MNWSARGNVLNQYLRNTSIGTTVNKHKQENRLRLFPPKSGKCLIRENIADKQPVDYFFKITTQIFSNALCLESPDVLSNTFPLVSLFGQKAHRIFLYSNAFS